LKAVRDSNTEKAIAELIKKLKIDHIDPSRIRVVKTNSESRAYARIWGVHKVIQAGLELKPHYVIEIVEPNFSKLECHDKVRVLIHELAHIPRTFSGYVRPHTKYFRSDLRKMLRRASKLLKSDDLKKICTDFL
jgi:predicted metallopeptidase